MDAANVFPSQFSADSGIIFFGGTRVCDVTTVRRDGPKHFKDHRILPVSRAMTALTTFLDANLGLRWEKWQV